MSSDFNWYLNRQGLRGLTGEKGDQGFSPYFTVEESTANQYRLRVHNENDSFVTENLRGNAIEIRNPDGNYIKYDHTTGDFYVDDADYATADSEGQIILATINDVVIEREPDFGDGVSTSNNVAIANENKAVTPAVLVDSLSKIIVNTDGNLSIAQNQDNSLTEIKLADEVIHPNLKYARNNNYLITGDIRYNNPIRVTKGILDDTGRRGCTFELMYDTNHFSRGSQGLILSNSIISFINNTRSDLETEKTVRGNADVQLQNAIDTERSERETQDSALQNQITNLTVEVNKKAPLLNNQVFAGYGVNVGYNGTSANSQIIMSNANTLSIQAPRTGSVEINGVRFKYLEEGSPSYSRYVDGAYTTDYFLRQDTVIAGDNITIEQDGKGIKISSTGGGGSSYVLPIASTNTLGGIKAGNWLKVNEQTGKLECGELTYSQYQSALGYTFISKTTLENVLANRPSGGAEIDDEDVSTTKVFSSSKTSELVGEVGNDLQDLTQRVNDIESLKVPNIVIIGEPLIQDGQVSGLDSNNHLQFPFILERQGRSWECNLSFTTGDNITTQQNIIDSRCSIALAVRNSDLVLALSSNGTTFNLGEHIMPDFLVQPNTTYYVRISYIDNMGYVLEADVAPITYGSPHLSIGHPSTPLAATTMLIGSDGNSFDGTIDLNKWSLKVDNELIWLGMDNVGQAVSANVSLSNINEAGKKVIFDNSIKMEAGDNIDISDKISHTSGDLTINKNNANIYFSSSGWNYTTQPITYECLPKVPFVGYNFGSFLYSSISISGEIYNGTIEVSKDGVSWITLTDNATAGTNYKIGQNLSESYFEFSHIRITPVSSYYAQLGVEGRVTGIQLNYIGIPSVDSSIKVISCPAIGNINSLLDEINGEVI